MKFPQLTVFAAALLLLPSVLFARLQVVTTTEDLAAIVREVGKDEVEVFAIAKGYQDPHFVDPKPSYLLKLRRADLLVVVGLELEVGWLPPLLENARNSRILPGSPGFLNASEGCTILQKPVGTVDRSMGDVHPLGNPHYWTDPENGRAIARHVAAKLSELDGAHEAQYKAQLAQFEAALTEKEKVWKAIASAFTGLRVVTYHNSWPNFAQAFGIEVVNHIEPKPGIPPSPNHLQALITQMKRDHIRVILMEPYFDEKLPKKIAAESGATLVVFSPSVGGAASIKTYFDVFDHNLQALKDAVGGHS